MTTPAETLNDEWKASFFLTDKELLIDFDVGQPEGRTVALEFRQDGEREIVGKVLSDINFYTQIINALSASLGRHS
jgi:hypothetical protein